MTLLVRIMSLIALIAGFGVSGYQLYLDRRIAVIEANAAMIAMANDPATPSRAKRWALENLAACEPIAQYDLRSAAKPTADRFCYHNGVDLREARFGPYTSLEDQILCPESPGTGFLGAVDALMASETRVMQVLNSRFTCANMAKAQMAKAQITEAHFEGARLFEANLSNTTWVSTKAQFASFDKACLNEATFRNSTLTDAGFTGASLHKAKFPGSDLLGADFTNAIVTETDFSTALNVDSGRFSGACVAGEQPTFPPGVDAPRFPACVSDRATRQRRCAAAAGIRDEQDARGSD